MATTLDRPRVPVPHVGAQADGSVRRTTSLDLLRPDGLLGDRAELRGLGRDRVRDADSITTVDHAAGLDGLLEYPRGRRVLSLSANPPVRGVETLIGVPGGPGFRRHMVGALEGSAAHGLVHQLLDDVPGVVLVGGYAEATTSRPAGSEPLALRSDAVDVCAGWRRDGTMVRAIERTGAMPLVTGPAAPDDPRPPDWHAMADLPALGLRRMRLLEVHPQAQSATAQVRGWFRDLFRPADGPPVVVHEYTLDAVVELSTLTVTAVAATPRVLPWDECPVAASGATSLIGGAVGGLRRHVRETFTGTATCTHLNDQYRALADVPALLHLIPLAELTE